MLMPKRVKRRKQFRGSMRGKASRGNTITYGEYGIIATELLFISCPKNINRDVAKTTNSNVNGLVKSNINISFSPYLLFLSNESISRLN